jgi:hypothetical protein
MVLAGRALAELRAVSRRRRIVLDTLLGFIVTGAIGINVLRGLAAQDTTYLVAKRWIEAHLPAGTAIAMSDIQVPQLTFTPEALARRRAWGSRPTLLGVLSPSQYHVVRGSRLAMLRDQTLTTGVAYDVYFLVTPDYVPVAQNLFLLDPDQLQEQFHIQAVVVTGVFGGPTLPGNPIVAEFYRSVHHAWRCVAEFTPGLTRSGSALWVYVAPTFADQLSLPEACRPLLTGDEQPRGRPGNTRAHSTAAQ